MLFPRRENLFVYIVAFGDGHQLVGLTKDMRKQLDQIRKSGKKGEENPRLDFLETVKSREAGEKRVAELEDLIKTSPHQVNAMTSNFHAHMREFGFEKW
jgi:hypothetical protein